MVPRQHRPSRCCGWWWRRRQRVPPGRRRQLPRPLLPLPPRRRPRRGCGRRRRRQTNRTPLLHSRAATTVSTGQLRATCDCQTYPNALSFVLSTMLAQFGGGFGEGATVGWHLPGAANAAEAPLAVGAVEGTGRGNERHGGWCFPSPLVGSYHRVLLERALTELVGWLVAAAVGGGLQTLAGTTSSHSRWDRLTVGYRCLGKQDRRVWEPDIYICWHNGVLWLLLLHEL